MTTDEMMAEIKEFRDVVDLINHAFERSSDNLERIKLLESRSKGFQQTEPTLEELEREMYYLKSRWRWAKQDQNVPQSQKDILALMYQRAKGEYRNFPRPS